MRRDIAAVALGAMLIGTMGTARELGPEAATSLGVAAVRAIVGSAVLVVLAWPSWNPAFGRSHWRLFLVGGAALAVVVPSFFGANAELGVAVGTILFIAAAPVAAGAIEAARGDRPSVRWLVATAVAVAGGAVMVLAGGPDRSVTARGLCLAIVGGAALGTTYSVIGRLIGRGVPSTSAVAGQFVIGSLPLAIVAGATQPLGWVASPSGLALAAHLGLVTVGATLWLIGYGMRSLKASTVATLGLCEPVTATVLAVVVLGERLAPLAWLGIAIVLTALYHQRDGPSRSLRRAGARRASRLGTGPERPASL